MMLLHVSAIDYKKDAITYTVLYTVKYIFKIHLFHTKYSSNLTDIKMSKLYLEYYFCTMHISYWYAHKMCFSDTFDEDMIFE